MSKVELPFLCKSLYAFIYIVLFYEHEIKYGPMNCSGQNGLP